MVLGRPPPTRQVLVAAAIGAVYGILVVLPTSANVLGITPTGVAWFVLSVALLFMVPVAYHVYVFWTILWIVYQVVSAFRSTSTFDITQLIINVAPPLASLVLLMTSGYLQRAQVAN